MGEKESQQPVQEITRDELIKKAAKGAALFVLGSLAGGFVEQFSADFYTFLKKALGFDLLVPPIRDRSALGSVMGIKLANQTDHTMTAVTDYVNYSGSITSSQTFSIPPRGTEFIDAYTFLENKVEGIDMSSDAPLAPVYVLDLRLNPTTLDLNISKDIVYAVEGWFTPPYKHHRWRQEFQVTSAGVMAVVGEEGIDVPFSKGTGVIHLDDTFIRDCLSSRNVAQGLLFIFMKGKVLLSDVPQHGNLTFPFETVLASTRIIT
jgi:hypothetical protein